MVQDKIILTGAASRLRELQKRFWARTGDSAPQASGRNRRTASRALLHRKSYPVEQTCLNKPHIVIQAVVHHPRASYQRLITEVPLMLIKLRAAACRQAT